MQTIRVICSHISHMPLHYVFRDSGIAEKYGFQLDLDIVGVRIPGRPFLDYPDRAPGLLNGEYQFISGLHHEPYLYRARGDRRFVYLAQTQNNWDDRLIASPKIQRLEELEGKKVMVPTLHAPCVIGNLKRALTLGGLDIDRVKFVEAPEVAGPNCKSAVDAVLGGAADAAHVDIPFDFQARKKGLRPLDLPEVPVIHNTTICTTRRFTEENEALVVAYLKALVEAVHYFKTKKAETVEILDRNLSGILGLGGRDEVEYTQQEWSKLLSKKPYPHPLAVWNVYDLDVGRDPKVNFISPFEVWDTHWLKAIDDSGFIDQLYSDGQPK